MIFKSNRSLICYLLILACMMVGTPAMARVLARGDGFVIDSSDVEAQKEYFSQKGFESTDAEHLNATLRLRLFAMEAKSSGLVDNLPEPTGPYSYEMAQEYDRLFRIYYQHLMETYPVSDDVVLSYYLSYPEKFLANKEGPKNDLKKEDLIPLEASIMNWIRSQIVLSKKLVIIQEEFDRLKKKYHVVIEK